MKINFTQAALAKVSCPPGKSRHYVYDSKTRGLCYCVTANGARSFYVYRKINGRPERIHLRDVTTHEQARQEADRVNGEIAERINPAEKRRQARGEMTLADTFTRYIEEYAKIHKRTWADDQANFDRYCAGVKGRKLSSINRHDIQTLHTHIGASHGKYSANRVLALLSKVFSFAADLGFSAPNPCKGVKRFKEQSRERFIQTDEIARFFAALDADDDKLMADYFRVLLFTGARRSNGAAMEWSDVSFGRRQWTVKGEKTKNGDPLTIDLTDEAIDVLKPRWDARKADAVYVFPSYGATGHIVEPKAAWKRIIERAKIDDLHIHDLRRSLGSWMASGGASLTVIGGALGHKSHQSTAVYARLQTTAVATARQLATSAMIAAATVKPEKTTKKTTKAKARKSA